MRVSAATFLSMMRIDSDASFKVASARQISARTKGANHRNELGRDGDLEMVTTGPVGMPLGGAKSGIRVVRVSDDGCTHQYYEFGELPEKLQ